ncbi:hypothetical protein [Fimbriiglobus ruber]|uniref:Uncharacterized protein n=1 Tax=Fimbriiglobus ruber TaxID=1908690 RepID=A0A225DCW2_9BACT|nr:hypothetical protein [Fimbriiglobus ruber]OWK34245.1 hypothetical protein FRUB_10216 [Fimbriiglobus ruber]
MERYNKDDPFNPGYWTGESSPEDLVVFETKEAAEKVVASLVESLNKTGEDTTGLEIIEVERVMTWAYQRVA